MFLVTNPRKNSRTIYAVGGKVRIAPGGSATVDISDAAADDERAAGLVVSEVGEGVAVHDPRDNLDRDGDGNPGGSLPYDPPALSNKPKAALIEIATAEGVEIESDMTVADIKAAIELAREG